MRRIDRDLPRLDPSLSRAILQRSRSRKIQANLQAPRVKAARPVHVRIHPEIMPFDADSAVEEAAVQRFPNAPHRRPSRLFRWHGTLLEGSRWWWSVRPK